MHFGVAGFDMLFQAARDGRKRKHEITDTIKVTEARCCRKMGRGVKLALKEADSGTAAIQNSRNKNEG